MAAKGHKPVPEKIINIPNVLTFIRLALVPVLLGLWEVQWKYTPITCAVIFITASVTDWLDGYLARKVSGKSTHAPCMQHSLPHAPMRACRMA